MKIAIAADHAGFQLKQNVTDRLEASGHRVFDMGTNTEESCDYPAYAVEVSQAVVRGEAERGILVCGTGLGMCITANKVAGIRAVGPCDVTQAEMSRRHNDANVLCLGARSMAPERVNEIVDVWLATGFEGGRHARRLELIAELEGK
ncbi:MAG: ribose 5-phosphate isomerase B [Actinobacteria bacterium]|nr:ribose 5-phosphate isomerase B [Actinomycetota bacterium]